MSSPNPDPARQVTLDEHVRSRIQTELSRLRSEEDLVRHQIEAALEKENLDKETELAKADDSKDGKQVTTSAGLKDDLEEIQKRADRYITRRSMEDIPEVKVKQEALLQCYSSVVRFLSNLAATN